MNIQWDPWSLLAKSNGEQVFFFKKIHLKSNLLGDKIRELVPKAVGGIVYDQTHDNESYFHKGRFLHCLPIIAQVFLFPSLRKII